MADDRIYYVLCADNCKFESMTKEQIIAAIAEATGKTPTDIDSAFISKIKEINKGATVQIWLGTTAEYNAITEKRTDVIYIKTDDSALDDLTNYFETKIKELQTLINATATSLQGQINEEKRHIYEFTLSDSFSLTLNDGYIAAEFIRSVRNGFNVVVKAARGNIIYELQIVKFEGNNATLELLCDNKCYEWEFGMVTKAATPTINEVTPVKYNLTWNTTEKTLTADAAVIAALYTDIKAGKDVEISVAIGSSSLSAFVSSAESAMISIFYFLQKKLVTFKCSQDQITQFNEIVMSGDNISTPAVLGGWTCRGSDGGVRECWKVENFTYSTAVAEGGNYAVTSAPIQIDFPSNFFATSPVCLVTSMGGGYPTVSIVNLYKGYVTIAIRTEWAVTDMQIWLQMYCIGN